MRIFCKKCGKEAKIVGYITKPIYVLGDLELPELDLSDECDVYVGLVSCENCKISCELYPFDGGLWIGKEGRLELVGEKLWKAMLSANIDGDLKENFEIRREEDGAT